MTIGERIKAAREKAGLTQVQLGEKVGVSGVAIMRYEKGSREPRYDQLQRIAAALGVSIYELFDGSTVDEDGAVHIWPAPQNASGEPAPELETLLDKIQDGEPLLLSPEELAKLKDTPKELIWERMGKTYFQDVQPKEHIVIPLEGIRSWAELGTLDTPPAADRIAAALDKLNEEGQEKAAERVEELTEIPRYQAQEPPVDTPQDTPAPQEGTDTTPAEMPPEEPIKPSEAIITICPICGQKSIGNPATGKAYCNHCKRSFPLPRY